MDAQTPAPLPSVSVVGRGRLGHAFARALRVAGAAVHGPTGRGEPVPHADIALLCVPDAEIPAAAAAAAGTARLVGHTSGATSIDDVDFGVHPLQTFTGDEDPAVFHGIGCAVAGRTAEATAIAERLAGLVGARPFAIDDDRRAAYHAAASIASNFLVTLEEAAVRVAGTAGIPSSQARAVLAPLVRRTVENWAALGPDALTGPIARGDDETVERQRAAIADLPDVLVLFDAFSEQTRALTARKAGAA